MRDSWLELVNGVLLPVRPQLEPCRQAGALHRAGGQLAAKDRVQALDDCRNRIEAARALVFAANDGIISSDMTFLEREWRSLSRTDPEAGLMDLWASLAPASWVDRKRWRDSDASAQLDAVVALTADASGVEAAEAALGALRVALAAWGVALGSRVRWRAFEADADCVSELLAAPLLTALAALAEREVGAVALERARELERAVQTAANRRLPQRPLLAQSLAHAAFVDGVLHAAALSRPNPVASLCALWSTGYGLAALDASGVTLEMPPLT
jgi:hypothetical protein